MKLKGLVSLLVVFTILTMSLACAAASYTTTAVYDQVGNGIKLVTTVTGATEGNMYTYAVYGGASGIGANGSISSATDAGITADGGETNLIYIEQKTADSSSFTFETPPTTADKVIGKKVVVGTNDSKNTAAGTFGFTADNDALCYSVKVNDAEWTESNLASITLAVTGWGNYAIDSADDVIYLPVGNAVTITFTPNDGYVLAKNGGYKLGGVDLGVDNTTNVSTPELSASNGQELTFTLPVCSAEEETLYVSIGEAVVQDNTITYYVDNEISADTRIGIDVTVSNGVEEYTITDLDMVNADATANSTGLCGIQIVDESNTLFGFESADGITYEVSPYYYNNGVKTPLEATGEGQYYIAE